MNSFVRLQIGSPQKYFRHIYISIISDVEYKENSKREWNNVRNLKSFHKMMYPPEYTENNL